MNITLLWTKILYSKNRTRFRHWRVFVRTDWVIEYWPPRVKLLTLWWSQVSTLKLKGVLLCKSRKGTCFRFTPRLFAISFDKMITESELYYLLFICSFFLVSSVTTQLIYRLKKKLKTKILYTICLSLPQYGQHDTSALKNKWLPCSSLCFTW